MATIRTRRSIAAALACAAVAVLTIGTVAQAATETPTDNTPVVVEDTFTEPAGTEQTIAPVDSTTQEADPATDPTLHQTPNGTWYYSDTSTQVSNG